MTNPLHQTLTTAGLDPVVAEIYIVLVEHGEQTVPEILQHTQLSRASVYDALAQLLAQSYVEYRKEGRNAYYKPVHPNKLFDLIEQKKREVALLEGEMKETVRSLSGVFHLALKKTGVKFYEGIEGMKEIYLDTLTEAEPIYALLSPNTVDEELKSWLNTEYVAKRIAAKIPAKVIVSSPLEDEYHKKDALSYRESVLVPPDTFPVEIEIDLYGKSKVAFLSYGADEMVGFVIDSKAIYTSMKSFFDLAWLQATQQGQSPRNEHDQKPV